MGLFELYRCLSMVVSLGVYSKDYYMCKGLHHHYTMSLVPHSAKDSWTQYD